MIWLAIAVVFGSFVLSDAVSAASIRMSDSLDYLASSVKKATQEEARRRKA